MAVNFSTRAAKFISAGSGSTIDNLSAFTYLLWVRPTSVAGNDYGLCGIGTFALQTRKDFNFDTTAGTIGCTVDMSTTDANSQASFTFTANTWYCLAATFGGIGTKAQIFTGTLTSVIAEVGSYSTQTTAAGTVRDSSASNFLVGNIGNGDRSMIGDVAVAMVFNRALTLGELRSLQFRPRKLSGCVLYYEPWSASSVTDLSGTGNTGTVTSGTVVTHVPLGPVTSRHASLALGARMPYPWGKLTIENAGDAILKNANYLADADGTSEPDYDKDGPSCVVKVSPTDYRCWFEGVTPLKSLDPTNQTGSFDYDTVTCYATSSDGLAWTKRDNDSDGITDTVVSVVITPTNPAGGSLAWMRGESTIDTVLFDPDANLWKAWGHGGNNTGPRAIFYATSSDGLSWTFENNGQPVLQKGSSGAWDDLWVADAKVIRLSPTSYLMLYRGQKSGVGPRVGLATSTDGVTWTKYAGNPVFTYGSFAWESGAIYSPGIVYDNGVLHMWYGGGSADNGGEALGYAYSLDLGQTWTRGPLNPVVERVPNALNSDGTGDTVTAYVDGTRYRIHYGAEKSGISPPFRGRFSAQVTRVPWQRAGMIKPVVQAVNRASTF